MRSKDKNRRKLRFEVYKMLLNYQCAHPDCKSGFNIEAHHVRPLSKGGYDKFWNIICLCFKCHRSNKLHSKYESKMIELYAYKAMQEQRMLGFIMDETEESFKEKYKNAIRRIKNLSVEERFIFENIEKLEDKTKVYLQSER